MTHETFTGDNDHGDTVPTPPQEVLRNITRERDALYANVILLLERIAQLERERDESRRWCCQQWSVAGAVTGGTMTAQDYAAEVGWDCFKENS